MDAARATSQISMPSSLANIANSLASAMLTCRKVFSSSFVSSAARGRYWDHVGDELAVEFLHCGQRRVVDARDYLRSGRESPGCVAGIYALRAKAEREVPACGQAAPCSRMGRSTSSVVPG